MKNLLLKTLMLKGESGNSIERIDKISAEGGVMQMRITLTDGSTVDFPVNDVPDTDLINQLIEIGIQDIEDAVDGLTHIVKETVYADLWTGAGPYQNVIAVTTGVSASMDFEIIGFTPTGDAETDESIKSALGLITYGNTGNNTITLIATKTKPTVNIPIVLRQIVDRGY